MLTIRGLHLSGLRRPRWSTTGRQGVCVDSTRRQAHRSRQGMACRASLMSKYQYQKRCAHLEEAYGLHMKDFGGRVLREGQSGADVLALQEFLSEELYLSISPYDSFKVVNGYFGSATKDALQLWQQDVGLPVTGVFDFSNKMRYTQYMEDKVAPEVSVDHVRSAVGAPSNPFLSTVPVHVFGLVGFLLALVAVQTKYGLLKRILSGRHPSKRATNDTLMAESRQEKTNTTEQYAMTRKKNREYKPARLSREELEMRIAPMKNIEYTRPRKAKGGRAPYRGASPGASVSGRQPSRAVGRDQGIETKYGTYYGGRQVWNTIKDNIGGEEVAMPVKKQEGMEQLGYPIDTSIHPNASLLDGTELEIPSKDNERKPVQVARPGTDEEDHQKENHGENVTMHDATTVILQDKPVKIHKPSRLM